MNKELKKRLFTSIIISLLTFFFIYQENVIFALFIICIFFISVFEWINLCNNKLSKFFGINLLIISFSLAFLLRDKSLSFFIFVILISISSDIGGFVFGKTFGGKKLTKISPNKTYAGAFGSYILSFITSLIYLNIQTDLSVSINNDFKIIYLFLIFFISTINQLGDLTISYFKRLKKVSDTGNLLPGHGGLLDRIDGMIFTLPVGYIFYQFL
jgi:phosphatidate cytidylyltransferase